MSNKPEHFTLAEYGWTAFYATAHADPVFDSTIPVRVMAVHRTMLDVAAPDFSGRIHQTLQNDDEEKRPTVGDWIAIEPVTERVMALYPRKSLFKRRNAGRANRLQLIAANVDTAFVVTSANQDFNVARLERYLALAHEADVMPVVVITKADLADDMDAYIDQTRAIRRDILVEAVNAKDAASLAKLSPWLGKGQTVALMGSSGVGKSTITNSLLGTQTLVTQGIREDDAKGRHTTSHRSLHRIGTGGWLIDTPGMREIQVVDSEAGIDSVFDDIVELAKQCRFSNCQHTSEPGCAVRRSLEAGELEPERLERFRKLGREERHNTELLYEAHARSRAFGKMAKKIMAEKSRFRSGE